MSFTSDYEALRKKRIEEMSGASVVEPDTEAEGEYFGNYNNFIRESSPAPSVDYDKFYTDMVENENVTDSDEASSAIRISLERRKKEKEFVPYELPNYGWLKAPKAFDDGYQFGDIFKSVFSTAGDVVVNFAKGGVSMVEGVADLTLFGVSGVMDLFGADDAADDLWEWTSESATDSMFAPIEGVVDKNSVFADKADAVVQGLGQMAVIMATGGIASAAGAGAAGVTAATTGAQFASSMGSGMSEATQAGATKGEAVAYGAMKGTVDAGSELVFGGLGKTVNALGYSRGISSLDDAFAKKLSSKISSQFWSNAVEFGVKASAEGAEEVLAGLGTAVAKKLSYMSDEELGQLIEDEQLLDQFIAGTVTAGIAQSGIVPGMKNGSLRESNKFGRDLVTGLTQNEQAVVDAEVEARIAEAEKGDKKLTKREKVKLTESVIEDLKKGYISTDRIESVLGGETYKSYRDTLDSEVALRNEYKELGDKQNATLAEQSRYAELKAQIKESESGSKLSELRSKLNDEMRNLLVRDNGKGKTQTDDYLLESYNEGTRRGQSFEADTSKYDAKQQETIKRAIDSGILNNTRRTHEFVDWLAKVSADKGVLFDFTNNAKLKESGFAKDGKTVNGFVTKDGITLNTDSAKYLNSVVGHEITHVLEGTEFYAELQNAVINFAKIKGEYDGRYKDIQSLYENVEGADINAELTADLVGDYLFTDSDFISHISTKNRNIFMKMFDEIKYLLKTATAGSKEARQLEKVKRAFEEAYRSSNTAQESTAQNSGAKYSIVNLEDGKVYVEASRKVINGNTRAEQRREISNFFSDLLGDNPSLDIHTIEGDVLTITRAETADKARDDYKTVDGKRVKLSDEEFAVKLNVESHIDEVAEVSTPKGQNPDTKEHPFAKDGFTYRRAYFKDFDGQYYEVTLSIGHNGTVATVYNVGKIKEGVSPSAKILAVVGSKPLGKTPSAYSISQNSEKSIENRKFSLSSDSDGKQLTKEQSEYFKDSKMRDDNGNLKVMYHGSQDAGFHTFDANMSDDDTSFFFVDRNDVAASYSGTSETYEAQTIRTAEDMNKFIESIGVEGYEVVEKDGKFTLLYEGDRVADSKTAQGIYDEFCWYEGVGEGDANYKVYLNLKNPLEVDAKGRPWNKIDAEFSQDVYDKYKSLTAEEKAALTDLAEWEDFRMFNSEIQEAHGDELASAYAKMGEDCNIYDLFSVAADNFSEESMRENARQYLKTRDYAQRAKEQGYDGVIFKNIIDNGGYSNGSEGASTVAIAFDSNQIKSVANEKPTGDPDIRYSLTEYTPDEKKAHNKAVVDYFGKTYNWAETGYVLLDGTRLDLSGKHEGAPGGYRSVDHRDIVNALGDDYGDGSYSGSLIQFMSEGNIRISPESNGINLSVKPTKEQEQALASFISRGRGEMLLDIDDSNGYTVVSVEYPKGTYYTKILNDIREWFDNGKEPEVSGFSAFRSLSAKGERSKRYGNYNVSGEEIRLESANNDIAPVKETASPKAEQVAPMSADVRLSELESTHKTTYQKYLEANRTHDTESIRRYSAELVELEKQIAQAETEIEAPTDNIAPADNIAPTVNMDNIAPMFEGEDNISAHLDELYKEREGLEDKIRTAMSKPMTIEEQTATAKLVDRHVELSEEIAKLEATEKARLNSLNDSDVPHEDYTPYYGEEEADTTPLNSDSVKEVAETARDILMFDEYDLPKMQEIISKYSEGKISREGLFTEIKENFGTFEDIVYEDERIKEVKRHIRQQKLRATDTIKGDMAYISGGKYGEFRKQNFGKVILTAKNGSGLPVDAYYEELTGLFGGDFFPPSIQNEADQLKRILEVMDMEDTVYAPHEIDDETLYEATDAIISSISTAKQTELESLVESESKAAMNDLLGHEAQNAPIAEADIAPIAEKYEAIKPKKESNGPRMKRVAEDVGAAPTYEKEKNGQRQRTMFPDGKTAKILTEEPEVAKKKRSAWSMVKNNVLDKGMVFEGLALKTGNRELQARWNSIRYAENKAQRLMEKGNTSVSSLKSIRETVEKSGKTEQFYEYLYHLHNVDRMSLESKAAAKAEELRQPFVNLKIEQVKAIAAKKITDTTTDKTAETIRLAREYLDAIETRNKPVFGDSVTAEVSEDIAAKLEKENPEFKEYAKEVYDYMNYLRELLVDGGVISNDTAKLWAEMYPHYVPIRRTGKDGAAINVPLDTNRTGINAPIKRATGGNSDILPLFSTMALRTEQTFKALAKNRFGVELKNTLGTTIYDEAAGVDDAIDSIDSHEELLQEGKNGTSPTFTVFENGKKVTFEITEEMYDAMKPTGKGLSYTNKALNKVSKFRKGVLTEYNPVFLATNAIKDVQDLLINSQHPASTYKNLPRAFYELGKKGKWYTEYMENGGEQNSYFDGKTNTFKAENKGFIKVIGMPLRAISTANNFIERAPRLAEYIASREAGASIEAAMLDAARVTTNFAAGGDVTKFLDRNGATFLNASVQGFNQQVRNVREAKAKGLKGWLGLATKFAIAGLPALLLNGLLWEDDEEYEELSDYVKQNYYVVAKFGDGQFVRIPKGRTVAVIQDAFQQVSNAASGDDEADFNSFFQLFLNNLAPNNPLDNSVISPIQQAVTNKTWYGEDLVPSRLQDLPKEEQYDESTDSLSKWLGEKLGMSPYKINYVLDQYSGGVGDVFLPMMTPEAESGDNSFGGKMLAPWKDKFTTDSIMNNQNVSDFYDTADELTANAKSSHATDKDILKSKYMNSVMSELGELYKQKRELQNSGLDDAEKYEEVRDLQKQINELAKNSLNTYNDVYIEDDYAEIGDLKFRKNDKGEWTKISDKQAEKQEDVTEALGIDPSIYWENKSEYDFAYEYPEQYAVAKSVGGYEAYKTHTKNLYDIKADKDKNGKSIKGSRKEKVIKYINSLTDLDYGERIILFKREYIADDTYNEDIVEYLNSREDISYKEMIDILIELGFSISADGKTATW